MKRTDIKTLIEAMRIISEGIQSEGGVANAAIAEAGQRLQEQNDYIEKLERVGDDLSIFAANPAMYPQNQSLKSVKAWGKLEESKP